VLWILNHDLGGSNSTILPWYITAILFAAVRSTGRSWVTKMTPDMIFFSSISSSISIKIFCDVTSLVDLEACALTLSKRQFSDYDRAVTTASPQSEPEVLTVGLGEAGGLPRRFKFMLVAVVLALLAGLLAWRFWPAPTPLFSLSDLQDVYYGMVRSDGTNDASVINPRLSTEEDGCIVPSACTPLFEATVLNRVPQDALDGVGTFLGAR
jgi:hypothetical protein